METFDPRSNDRIAESVRLTEERFTDNGSVGGLDQPPYFAKITALAQDEEEEDIPTRAKGELYYYDSDAYEYLPVVNGWIFDDDSSSTRKTGDIYSPIDLAIDDIVEVVAYNDKTATGNQMQWLVRTGGGAGGTRATVTTPTGLLLEGAILTSPTDFTVVTEFSEPQNFLATLPWNGYGGLSFTASLPDNFVFLADNTEENTYYTSSFPSTVWARANAALTSGATTNFDVLDGRFASANILTKPVGSSLKLQGYAGGSTASDDYFIGKYFAVSFDHATGDFYLDHPVF